MKSLTIGRDRKAKKEKLQPATTVRFFPSQEEKIEEIKKHLGCSDVSVVIRHVLESYEFKYKPANQG